MGNSKTVTSRDGTKIAYEQSGIGQPVILVDGAMGYRDYRGGRPLAAALSKHFTVIAYDRRRRGESTDTQPYAVEREIEDIDALIGEVGSPIYLDGFSSGSVLALRAAAKLGSKVAKLAVMEPPFGGDDAEAKAENAEYVKQMAALVKANQRSEAVAFFLGAMLPPDMLEGMKQTPDWALMEAVAHTLVYDNEVMGDGAVPVEIARAATMPAMVLDSGESPDLKREAADVLASVLPHARRKTLEGETTLAAPEVIAPLLVEFFTA